VPIHLELVFIVSSQAEFLTGNATDTVCCQHRKYYEMSFKKIERELYFPYNLQTAEFNTMLYCIYNVLLWRNS